MFKLGNFTIAEILLGVGEQDNQVLFTLDQLMNASIEMSSESQEITDKKGNRVRTIYKSKNGTFTATNAFLHPQILALASGTNPEYAGTGAKAIDMPKIVQEDAGKVIDLSDMKDGTLPKVIGVFGNGANDIAKTKEEVTAMISGTTLTLPAAGKDLPVSYVVVYERSVESGIKIVNDAYTFPETYKLTLQVSYFDICDDQLKLAYVVLPKFQPSPDQTISLNAEDQNVDFNGSLNVDYCSGTQKTLYTIYFADNDTVETGEVVTGNGGNGGNGGGSGGTGN